MDDDSNIRRLILEDPGAVARAACKRIVQASKRAIVDRGEFHIVLAGGSTPERTYTLLAAEECDWKYWHLWFGDERCLPRDDPGRNSVMVERTLSSKVAIPVAQVHVIPAELGPEPAARLYAEMLECVSLFDMVLLGMGEDGHTASLFPGHQYPADERVLAIVDSPKLPSERVSLSAETLSNCRQLLFIVTGSGKAGAITQWRNGVPLPVNMVRGQGKTEVISDQSAFIT